tara:strand:- start:3625 stop:4107 length:483 start_codon:yes stop_codon:yes gene_type:complete
MGCSVEQNIWGYDLEKNSLGDGLIYFFESDIERLSLTFFDTMDYELAAEFIDESSTLFESLFEEQRVGYAGQHTRFISCPEEYKPLAFSQNISQGKITYFISYANSNFVAGVCVDDLIMYKSVHGWIYCDLSRKLIQVDYFISKDLDVNTFIEKITCEGI